MLSYVKWLAETAYNYAVSAINGLNSWIGWFKEEIKRRFDNALGAAIIYAYNLYIDINRFIRDVRHTIEQNIQYYFSLARMYVDGVLAPLWLQIQTIIGLIATRIKEAFNAWIAPIWEKINPIIQFVRDYIRGIIDTIKWVFSVGVSIPGQIAALWSVLTNDIIPKIVSFVRDTVPTVSQIASDPFGYVYPYLKEYLWELLQWILAYQMGTVKYNLPPFPSFNFVGAGGALPLSESLAIDNSDLHRPLDSLYISGYRFHSGHQGLDLGLTNGTPVYAMHDGIVDLAVYGTTGYAVQVVIRGDHWWSRYAHCMKLLVEKNDPVRAGQIIALGDSTGNSTGPHLHLEIKYDGRFVDPVTVLPI